MVTTFYPPHNFGGDGIFVYRLANALAQRGHSVRVIYNADAFGVLGSQRPRADAYPHHPNVSVHPLTSGRAKALDLLAVHQLGRPVMQRNRLRDLLADVDVIHFHNISLVGGPDVLRWGDAVKLCTLHECWLVCPMHILWRFDREVCTRRTCLACTLAGKRPPQLWRYTGRIARAAQSVDCFIGPSAFLRDIYHANGFPAPIEVLPHFLPPPSPLEAAPSPAERPYFLYVGRLEKIKGVQVLIEAFRQYRGADLVIAGTGAYEAELRAQAADLPHVRFAGFLYHDQLAGLYRGAVAALVPSLCYESFGWATLEAFVHHTPVIVHDLGALPEVAADGGLTYRTLPELVEALHTLAAQPGLRQRLGEAGYARYEAHYTEARHLDGYAALIEQAGLSNARTLL